MLLRWAVVDACIVLIFYLDVPTIECDVILRGLLHVI